ncbi:protein app1-like [Chenopodium quinoa]|uniref:protein app1-like n=1 Tax=Chenopodium quinoa TaxID=63459 RepID=UPI000B78FD6F|nr:protein app1-like [Chenopodium quinoa]
MVSDQEIAEGLEALFRETNPNSFTSLNEVIHRLQSKLGFDLSTKIDFIRAHISFLFSTPQSAIPPPSSAPAPATVSPVVVSRPHPQNLNVNPNPNPNNSPNVVHPQLNVNVVHPQHRVFHHPPPPSAQSYFPRGPTEISFAQPGTGTVVSDSLSSPTAKESTQSRPKRRGGPGGLNKLCGVSPQLQAIVGQPALPRTEIVKQLWAYIRKNNLQDPSNKRKIICNDELRLVFEVDCTDMFQMNKLLSKHIVPLDPTKVPEQPSKKAKVEEAEVPSTDPAAPDTPAAPAVSAAPVTPAVSAASVTPDVSAAPVTPVVSAAPVTPAAIAPPAATVPPAPIVISEALAKFFGTSEKEMPQSEVYKRIEEYIKAQGLEDPLNSMVRCDTKLQELLGCESIPAPGIREALARNHLFQRA